MDKNYEAFKEILDEQIKRIAKKGDISQQELENVYKASSIVLDMETREAMKKAEEQQKQGGQSNAGGSYNSQSMDSSYNSYNRGGNSNHIPPGMFYDMTGRGGSYERGYSYSPVWNQENMEKNRMMAERMGQSEAYYRDSSMDYARDYSQNRGSYDSYEGGSNDGMSNRRGRDARGRYTSRDGGSYDGSYDSYDSYARDRGRGRSRNYSRDAEKDRMIEQLEDMMEKAPDERSRKAIMRCMDKLDE